MRNFKPLLSLLLICFLAPSIQATAQDTLSRELLLKDFDYLRQTVKDVTPRIHIYQQITGYDIVSKMDDLRATADTAQSFTIFYKLMEKYLQLTQDRHNNFTLYPTNATFESNNTYITTEAQKVSQEAFKHSSARNNHLPSVRYVNGSYYFVQELEMYKSWAEMMDNKVPLFTFSPYTELIAINDIPIDNYVSTYSENLGSYLRWDSQRKKLYTQNMAIDKANSNTLTLKSRKGEINIVVIYPKALLSLRGKSYKDFDTHKVQYFPSEQVLYIRIPEMELDSLELYQQEIAKYKTNMLSKVIVDVRDNPGGNDRLWKGVLANIIDQPITFSGKLLLRNTQTVINYLNDFRNDSLSYPQKTILNVGNDDFFCRFDYSDSIHPSETTIGYNGNIYVLYNYASFSSSLAFVSICNQNDRLVSVGQPIGFVGGRGITPFFFSLPHSKIIFEISPTLDATNVKELADYFQDEPEILIEPSIDEEVMENTWTKNRYDEEFLYRFDPMFRKVLELY